jgi:nucleotide-binding universal stress UspA family protein
MNIPRIIVGVDDSPASRAALGWAVDEAARRRCEVVAVHAYEWRVSGALAPIGGPLADQAREWAETFVSGLVQEVRTGTPGVEVRGKAVLGSPGRALIAASTGATLVVVGSRGRGGFTQLLLGSVSQQVATHAHAPVVVVREGAHATAGPIVVGVDGSESADHAFGLACAEAEARGCGVVAVRVNPVPDRETAALLSGHPERRAAQQAALAEHLGPWADKFPGVAVEVVVADGHPAGTLIGLSASAQLVVVGTRGHGGFTGMLLGSVGQALLHHAHCPVLIVREPAPTA